MLKQFDRENLYAAFTTHRAAFENFILKYKNFANQVTTKWGSGIKGFDKLKDLYRLIFDYLVQGDSEQHILAKLQRDSTFKFLSPLVRVETEIGADFSTETKSQAYLREAIETPVRCKICNARLHTKSISIDHKIRKEDGDRAILTTPKRRTLIAILDIKKPSTLKRSTKPRNETFKKSLDGSRIYLIV